MHALKKWQSDLLGTPIYVYTDPCALENFETQWDLSWQQLRWQELLSQFEMTIVYIHGEENTVADTLSCVLVNGFSGEQVAPIFEVWNGKQGVNAVLCLETDTSVLAIKAGYEEDHFYKRLVDSKIASVSVANGLIYVGSCLVIPQVTDIWENLFRLAHDCLGHFGSDKLYAVLCKAYYWPNMQKDLERGYIPGCVECQHNKAQTTKPARPLHPLSIPE